MVTDIRFVVPDLIRNPGKYVELETRLEDGIDRKENLLWQDLNDTISLLDSGSSPERRVVVVISVDELEHSKGYILAIQNKPILKKSEKGRLFD